MSIFEGPSEERASEYRKRAEECYANAAATTDDHIRTTFIEIANSYLLMAKHIETRELRRVLKTPSPLERPHRR